MPYDIHPSDKATLALKQAEYAVARQYPDLSPANVEKFAEGVRSSPAFQDFVTGVCTRFDLREAIAHAEHQGIGPHVVAHYADRQTRKVEIAEAAPAPAAAPLASPYASNDRAARMTAARKAVSK